MKTNWITVIVGILSIAYSIHNFYYRWVRPGAKKKTYEKFWYDRVGTAIYDLSGVITPIILGIFLIWIGFNGISLSILSY